MSTFWRGSYWYLSPFIFCKNQYFRHEGGFPLPFENLPQTDLEQLQGPEDIGPQVLPPDGWKATFGCFACGLVEVYEAGDVDNSLVEKASEGVYHNDAVCMWVEVQCADKYCRVPDKWYVDISDATENDLRQRLQRGYFFGKLPCRHEIRTTLDKSSFRIYRVMNRLWPKL